jgi:hypothetical protein
MGCCGASIIVKHSVSWWEDVVLRGESASIVDNAPESVKRQQLPAVLERMLKLMDRYRYSSSELLEAFLNYGYGDDHRSPEDKQQTERVFNSRDAACFRNLQFDCGVLLDEAERCGDRSLFTSLEDLMPQPYMKLYYRAAGMEGGFVKNCRIMLTPLACDLSWTYAAVLASVVGIGAPTVLERFKEVRLYGMCYWAGGSIQSNFIQCKQDCAGTCKLLLLHLLQLPSLD